MCVLCKCIRGKGQKSNAARSFVDFVSDVAVVVASSSAGVFPLLIVMLTV